MAKKSYVSKAVRAANAKADAAKKAEQIKKTNKYRAKHGQKPLEVESPVVKESPVSKVSRGNGRRTKEQRQADKRQQQGSQNLSRKEKKQQQKQQQQKKTPQGNAANTSATNYDLAFDPKVAKLHEDNRLLDRLDFGESAIGSMGHTAATGFGSLVGGLKEKGALKKAGIGIAQSSVASAAGHAGLAAIQGEDPWEAAKTGAVRGAFVGTGYQGLKVATAGQEVKGIKNTLKHISSTSKQMYQAHTLDGNIAMRGNVSNQLKRVLEQNKRAQDTGGIFGLK